MYKLKISIYTHTDVHEMGCVGEYTKNQPAFLNQDIPKLFAICIEAFTHN